MSNVGQTGRLCYAIGVGLFGVALVAGVVQSLLTNGRLPAIDLLANGSGAYVNFLLARKDNDRAIEQLEMQLRLFPHDADLHEQVGKLLDHQDRPEEAQAHFQELVRLRPKYAEGFCLLGFTCMKTNQPGLAIRFLKEAIELNPQNAKAFNDLGVASARVGDMAEAVKYFARAVELAPNSLEAQTNLKMATQELQVPPKTK